MGMPVTTTIHAHEVASILGLSETEPPFPTTDGTVVGSHPDRASTQHRRTDQRERHNELYTKPRNRWHQFPIVYDLKFNMSEASANSAIVLLSGGLDSTTVLAIAKAQGYDCHTLAFDYGQRHRHELEASEQISRSLGASSHRVFPIDIGSFGGSALTADIEVPKGRDESEMTDIPITYVPARNLVFLSIAMALGETLGAKDLFIGVNAVDYSGYPDCRPEFIESFTKTANLATKMGVDGDSITIHTPLMELAKAEIISMGVTLGVDYAMTHSCYDPIDSKACGECDSCILRKRGFEQAGIDDPTVYA